MTMLPDAVFFDWDGTLVDSLDFLLTAHNHVRTVLGEPLWSVEDFHGKFKFSSRQLYPMIYPGREQLAFDALEKFMDAHHLDHLNVLNGSAALLATLHRAGVPMGVVSNKRAAFVTREVTHLGWDKYFRVVAGSGYAAQDKPDAGPLLKALAAAGVGAGTGILYVGDTETDLLCARNAGCRAVFLYHKTPANPLIQTYNPYISAKDCAGLEQVLFPPGNCHKFNI